MSGIVFQIQDRATATIRQVEKNVIRSTKNMSDAEGKYAREIAKTQTKMFDLKRESLSASKSRQSEIRKEIKALRDLQSANKAAYSNAKLDTRLNEKSGGTLSILGTQALGMVGGGAVAAYAAVNIAKDILKTNAEYQKSVSTIRGLLEGNEELTLAVSKNALNIAKTSSFTAKELSNLNVILLKYGFSAKEAIQSTQGIVTLAEATGISLEEAASVGAATLRGFNLKANAMGTVSDVMAKAFNSSALDIEKFRESMKYVAPVAASAGISIQRTTAMLGALADAGVSGSHAGTSLRRILTDASISAKKNGISIEQALQGMYAGGMTVADAFDEVGRTAQTSLTILAKDAPKIDLLTDNLDNAEGSASKLSATMKDNLLGDVDRLESAYDVFKSSVISGNGLISDSMRGVVQSVTSLIGSFQDLNDGKFLEGSVGLIGKLLKLAPMLNPSNYISTKIAEGLGGFNNARNGNVTYNLPNFTGAEANWVQTLTGVADKFDMFPQELDKGVASLIKNIPDKVDKSTSSKSKAYEKALIEDNKKSKTLAEKSTTLAENRTVKSLTINIDKALQVDKYSSNTKPEEFAKDFSFALGKIIGNTDSFLNNQ